MESTHDDRRLVPMKQMAACIGLAALVAVAAGCRKEEAARQRVAALARIESLARFRPPADGQLTDAQIDRYLRVRRAARGRAEADAARAAGVDPEEYSWTRARIIEALVALDTRKVKTAAEETYAKTIASLKQARQAARDREAQRTLDEQIAGLERERASLKQPEALPSWVTANAKRAAPRRAEIEALSP